MPRFVVIGGFRGFFLVFMLINHLNGTLPLPFAVVNHARLGFVEDAQGFVLLSGVVSGLLYGGLALKAGDARMRARIHERVATILRYHLGVLAVVAALIWALPSPSWIGMAPEFSQDYAVTAVTSATLIYQPTFMDILPMYMIYLGLTPFMIGLIRNGRTAELLAGSVLLWMLAQTGLVTAALGEVETAIRAVIPAFKIRWGFDPLGWQILFVFGVWAGFRLARKSFDPVPVLREMPERLSWIGCAAALTILALKFTVQLDWLGSDYSLAFHDTFVRYHFSILHLVNFVLYLFLVMWLLIAGPAAGFAPLRWLAAGLH